VNLVENTFNPLFTISVILPVCSVIMYFVPCANLDLGVIFSVVPVIFAVNGIDIPLPFLKSINGLLPILLPH
jgi:hypothetical protein